MFLGCFAVPKRSTEIKTDERIKVITPPQCDIYKVNDIGGENDNEFEN